MAEPLAEKLKKTIPVAEELTLLPNRQKDIDDDRIWLVIGLENCPWTAKTKKLLDDVGQSYQYININAAWHRKLLLDYSTKRLPAVFAGRHLIGSYAEVNNYFMCSFVSDKELFM